MDLHVNYINMHTLIDAGIPLGFPRNFQTDKRSQFLGNSTTDVLCKGRVATYRETHFIIEKHFSAFSRSVHRKYTFTSVHLPAFSCFESISDKETFHSISKPVREISYRLESMFNHPQLRTSSVSLHRKVTHYQKCETFRVCITIGVNLGLSC